LLFSAVGIRLDYAWLRVAIALRLGALFCARLRRICADHVDSSNVYGLSCRQSTSRHVLYSLLNDFVERPRPQLRSHLVRNRRAYLNPTANDRQFDNDAMEEGPAHGFRRHVPNTLAQVISITMSPSAVATFAEDISLTRSLSQLLSVQCHAVDEEALATLIELGARIVTITRDRRSFLFLVQELCLAVLRVNAASSLRTQASASDPIIFSVKI
jgi:hypothetical protein